MLIRLEKKKERPTTEIYPYCFSDYKTDINYFKKPKQSKYCPSCKRKTRSLYIHSSSLTILYPQTIPSPCSVVSSPHRSFFFQPLLLHKHGPFCDFSARHLSFFLHVVMHSTTTTMHRL